MITILLCILIFYILTILFEYSKLTIYASLLGLLLGTIVAINLPIKTYTTKETIKLSNNYLIGYDRNSNWYNINYDTIQLHTKKSNVNVYLVKQNNKIEIYTTHITNDVSNMFSLRFIFKSEPKYKLYVSKVSDCTIFLN